MAESAVGNDHRNTINRLPCVVACSINALLRKNCAYQHTKQLYGQIKPSVSTYLDIFLTSKK